MFLTHKKFIASILMSTMLFFTPPKQAEAIFVPIITNALNVVTVIADLIIVCVIQSANGVGFCGGSSGSGGGSAGSGGGTSACGSITPPNSTCTNFPLDDNSLVLNPEVVREGDDFDISWNTGQNFPANCTLTGPNIEVTLSSIDDLTGTVTTTATGPHVYTLACGTESVTKTLKILPTITES